MTKLFVGSLAFSATEHDLEVAFGEYGSVSEVKIITDRDTSQSRGFAFLTFENDQEAENAIAGMDGAVICGRKINVSIARPKEGGSGSRQGGGGRRDNRRGRDDY